MSSAENQNYGVDVSQLALEGAKRDTQRNRAGHYPTLDLVSAPTHNKDSGQPTASGTTTNNAIGVQ